MRTGDYSHYLDKEHIDIRLLNHPKRLTLMLDYQG